MNRMHAIAALCGLLFASQASAQVELTRSVVAGGGGHCANGAWELTGTIGQADAADVVASGSFQLTSGFWLATPPPPPEPCTGDTNGDRIVDLIDLAEVLSAFGRSGEDLLADLDGNGQVDVTDLATVLAFFGVACP